MHSQCLTYLVQNNTNQTNGNISWTNCITGLSDNFPGGLSQNTDAYICAVAGSVFGVNEVYDSPCVANFTSTISSSSTSICSGSSVTLSVNFQGGYTYQWYRNGVAIAGAVGSSYAATTAGTYYCRKCNNWYAQQCINSNSIALTVVTSPSMTSATTATLCSGTALSFPLTSSIASSTFSWIATTNANVTGESTTAQATANINNTLSTTAPTAQNVVYTVTPSANGCAGAPQTVTISVKPLPAMTSATSSTVCSGTPLSFPLTSSIAGSTFSWLATANAGVTGESTAAQATANINNTLATTAVTTQNVVYTVTPTASGCLGAPQTVTISVKPLPTMTSATTGTVCSGTALNFPLTSNIVSTFSWLATANANVTGESTTAQATANINNTLSTTATTAQNVVYTVTPTAIGCAGVTQTVTISVKPLPAMTSATTGAVCSGTTLNFALTSNITSTYSWVATANANVTGESTTAQPTALINNTLSTALTATQNVVYTVTPSANGCSGLSQAITIAVNPLPSVTSPNVGSVCSGGALNFPLTSNISSTYSWLANSNTNVIGESTTAQGTANISNTLSITSTTTENVIYAVTPISNGCVGLTQNVTISVNPLPSMTSATSEVICAGGILNFPLTSNIVSTFSWVALANANVTGESTTPQLTSNINNILSTTSTTTQNVVYSVTPIANGCAGSPQTVTISVNPLPVMTNANSGTICSGETLNLALTSNITSTYSWVASENLNVSGESTIGQSSMVIDNTLLVNSLNPETVVYTVTPTSNGCIGTSQIYAITVKPLPVMTSSSNGSVCSGTALNFPLTSSIVSSIFSWNALPNDFVTGESTIAQALANINNTLSTADLIAQNVIYSVTPIANGCAGAPQAVTILVNPLPSMISPSAGTVCSGTLLDFPFEANIIGGYSWMATENSAVDGESTNIQSSLAIGDILSNSSANAEAVSYTVTPIANGCLGESQLVTITVNPLSTMTSVNSVTVCSGSGLSLPLTSNIGASYNWVATENTSVEGESTNIQTTATIDDILLNSSEVAEIITYAVTPIANGCVGPSQIVSVEVNPSPTPIITYTGDLTFCEGSSILLFANPVGALQYQWNLNGTVLLGSIDSSIAAIANGNYSVDVTNIFGCTETSTEVLVTVNPNSNFYTDTDSDGFGDLSELIVTCVQPSNYVLNNLDCDDTNIAINPNAVEICNSMDDDCNGQIDDGLIFQDYFVDFDGDGFGAGTLISSCIDLGVGYVMNNSDCNDQNSSVNSSVSEICNNIDDNCNEEIDEGFDLDFDSFTSCSGDCDDTNSSVFPGALELEDSIDNNCDGFIDEGFDIDGDGYSESEGDCNDASASINPGATEICNGIDDDCDTQIDEGFDLDADGYTSCNGDCDDNNIGVYPGAIDIDDNIDNDCDGLIDENADSDGDGFTPEEGDCNDSNPNTYPNAQETCNELDDDCDSLIDEDLECEIEVFVSNGLSLNSDGINDFWVIQGIDQYPNCMVTVVNRWNQTVFQSVGYSTPWDGTFNGTALPVGDYFYVIKLTDDKTYTGFISIKN